MLVAPACDHTTERFAWVDAPEPVPRVVATPTPPEGTPAAQETLPKPGEITECRRGTGRNAEGQCEVLPVRDREQDRVQQVMLPAGTFVMGDIPPRYDAAPARAQPSSIWSGNPPRHTLTTAFWIDLHEVTREAYEACVKAGSCTPAACPVGVESRPVTPTLEPAAEAKLPQTCVSHAQAMHYCETRGGRLPSEAEWEYAARGVDARLYPWGNDLRDEYGQTLILPVTSSIVDKSYFGLQGLGTNAEEWVAERFELDVGLASFLERPFRRPDGPLAQALARSSETFVVKHGRAGSRSPGTEPTPQLGFRCAADLGGEEPPLAVPDPPAPVPLVAGGALEVFGGVAEAVTRTEAEAFCSALRVEWQGAVLDDWRLPTLEEVGQAIALFRGPGPFWAAEGAVVQRGTADDPWENEPATPDEPLAARCVRARE